MRIHNQYSADGKRYAFIREVKVQHLPGKYRLVLCATEIADKHEHSDDIGKLLKMAAQHCQE